MLRKKKIEELAPPEENDHLLESVLEKHHKIICRSKLVANNEELAKDIVSRSKLVRFPKGHVLLKQGDDADDVYFLLFGSVGVYINSNFIDSKEATETVGEMAAMKPGSARSADVIVSTPNVEARVISAHDFRDLMSKNAEFRERLSDMVDSMNRKNIRLLGDGKSSSRTTWTWASVVFGAVVGVLCGVWFGLGGSPVWVAILFAIGAGASGTLVAIRMDPDFIYRNMFWLSGTAMIAQAVQTLFSLSFSVNGTRQPLPFLWNFSSNPEQKWWGVAIIYLSLAGLALMSWLADRDLRRSSNRRE